MSYAVKEIFYTLQGEGINAGRPAVFCRFAGCNLWSGREEDRTSAVCRFCDTDFVGTDGTAGGRYAAAADLAAAVALHWPQRNVDRDNRRLVVLTGGEPLLQVDGPLIDALHAAGFQVAVETNGTIAAPDGLDWICVSPKAGAPLAQCEGDELKVVVPQDGLDLSELAALPFVHRLLQPMDGPLQRQNVEHAVRLCLADPRWRLSLQTHKVIGIR
jgi:7-carboxy-7-deazaguanine synthase (Cx14CxxC type)